MVIYCIAQGIIFNNIMRKNPKENTHTHTHTHTHTNHFSVYLKVICLYLSKYSKSTILQFKKKRSKAKLRHKFHINSNWHSKIKTRTLRKNAKTWGLLFLWAFLRNLLKSGLRQNHLSICGEHFKYRKSIKNHTQYV